MRKKGDDDRGGDGQEKDHLQRVKQGFSYLFQVFLGNEF